MRFTTEMQMRVYNDHNGDYISVKDDADSLGLVEINSVCDGGVEGSLVMPVEQAEKLVEALQTFIDYRKANPLD